MMLESRLRELLSDGRLDLPFPARGQTAARHRQLIELARKDLTLARLVEAHTDAVAILAEAGRQPQPGALYGVWASETANQIVSLSSEGDQSRIAGSKMFCTGA